MDFTPAVLRGSVSMGTNRALKSAITKRPLFNFYKKFHFPAQTLCPQIGWPGLRFPSGGTSLPSKSFLAGVGRWSREGQG